MVSLIGSTGFVGGNLARQYAFDGLYNSKNISEAFGTSPDVCFYAGVPAEKFLANNAPEKDRAVIDNAIANIQKINPKKLVLISTIDVYKNPRGVSEATPSEKDGLHAYGLNRLILEEWAGENTDCLTVRLPALFGEGIKKNFIYDMLNVIPSMLNKTKYDEMPEGIRAFYEAQENGFYKCRALSDTERAELRGLFEDVGFSATSFTDSRAVFPFYNLEYLKEHIDVCLAGGLKLVNFAVEPLSAAEIHAAVKGKDFVNECAANVPHYDFTTLHSELFGRSDGYIFGKEKVLSDIVNFAEGFLR